MAAQGFSFVLELAIPADAVVVDPRSHSDHEAGECWLGRPENSWRAENAGHSRLASDSRKIQGATPKAAVANMAYVSDNHVKELVSVDFFTVPTALFQILYVFLILSHDRRNVIHFNVTAHPTAAWTAHQLVEAFPFDTAPRYLLRDRDAIYGARFRSRVHSLAIDGTTFPVAIALC